MGVRPDFSNGWEREKKAGVALFLVAVIAPAQTGTITGTIADPAGAAVPGVKVTAVKSESGARLETASNGAGVYRVRTLLPDSLEIWEFEGLSSRYRQKQTAGHPKTAGCIGEVVSFA
jgi:hypothetical protein